MTDRGLAEGRANLNLGMQGIDASRNDSLARANADYAQGRNINRTALELANAANTAGLSTSRGINRTGLNTSRGMNAQALDLGRGVNRIGLDVARGGQQALAGQAQGANRSGLDLAREMASAGYGVGMRQAGASGNQALSSLQGAYQQGLGDITNPVSNYIAQIATPQIQQQMALQGLEGSGAVNASIGRATAEAGLPLMQQLLSGLLSGTTDIAGRRQATEGALGDRYLGGEQALGGQYLAGEQDIAGRLLAGEQALGGQYLSGEQALAQGYQGAESGLGGQYLQGEQGLGSQYLGGLQSAADRFAGGEQGLASDYLGATTGINQQGMQALQNLLGNFQSGQYGLSQGNQAAQAGIQQNAMGLGAQFAQSLPGAAETLGLLPARERAMRAQAATGLFPMADYARNLRQQDLTRRQDLYSTAFTGIPFTSGGTQKQDTSTKPLFNLFGMG